MSHQRDSLQTLQNRTIKELEKITSNTENIEVSVDNVELDLEQFSGHSNNTTAIGDGSTQLRVVPLGYNQSAGQVRSMLVDAAGHQQIDLVSGGDITSKLDSFAGAGNNNVGEASSKLQVFNYGRDVAAGNFKPLVCNSSAEQIVALSSVDNTVLDNISAHTATVDGCVASNKMNVNISSLSGGSGLATEAKQDVLEASLTSIESKIDVLDTVLDNSLLKHTSIDSSLTSHSTIHTNAETHLGNIDTGIDVLEACVGSNKVNVNISSDGASLATSAGQTTTQNKLDILETTLTAIETDAAALEVLQTSTNTKLDHLSDNLDTLDGSLNTIEACVGSNKVNVNISSGNISGFATSALQGAGLPSALSSDNLKVSIQEGNITGFATSTLQGTTNSKLDTIDGSINTLEACVGSNKVNVNISSDGASLATSANQTTTNNKLDILETTLTAIETDAAALEVLQTTTNSKLDTIDGSINTLEACVGSNKVNVNISSDGASLATEAKQDVLEASLTSIEGKIDTLDSVLDAAEVHLGNIETAVQALDNSVDGNFLNVNLNLAGSDVANNSGNKSNTCPRVVVATDDVNLSQISSAQTLTTTQLHNGTSISGSGGSDTHSTLFTFTSNPRSITIFAADSSGAGSISGSQIGISPMVSMDNSTFFDLSTALSPGGGSANQITKSEMLREAIVVIENCRFKFLKVKITNNAGGAINFDSFVCF